MKRISFVCLFLFSFSSILAQNIVDFSKLFKDAGVEGGFYVYDYQTKKYIISDKIDFMRASSPASTFKIPNSMIGLEEKAIKDENDILKWDGTKRWNEAWNADQDLKNAYKNSTVWFYQEIARRIGEKKYKYYLKACDYGNQNISDGLTTFWLGTSLKITPKNQLEFLVKLYEKKLPFSERTFEIMKKIMVREENKDYILRAKTGWEQANNTDTGWFVGYIEKQKKVYFFATRIAKPIDKKMPDFANQRIEITNKALKQLGIL